MLRRYSKDNWNLHNSEWKSNHIFIMYWALGISRNTHEKEENYVQKSLSISETFKNRIKLKGEFEEMISQLSQELSRRAKNQNLVAKNLSLELKDTKFETKIRSKQMKDYTSDQESFYKYAIMLLNEVWPYQPVRLIGLSLGNIITVDEYERRQKGCIKNFLNFKPKTEEESKSIWFTQKFSMTPNKFIDEKSKDLIENNELNSKSKTPNWKTTKIKREDKSRTVKKLTRKMQKEYAAKTSKSIKSFFMPISKIQN